MRGNTYPAKQDWAAADYLVELRESRGLSREALADEITRIATKSNSTIPYTVSARSIYRYEEEGAVPGARIKFALAEFYGVPLVEIWQPVRRARRRAAA